MSWNCKFNFLCFSTHNHVILFCDIFLLLSVSSISYLQCLLPRYVMLSSYERICEWTLNEIVYMICRQHNCFTIIVVLTIVCIQRKFENCIFSSNHVVQLNLQTKKQSFSHFTIIHLFNYLRICLEKRENCDSLIGARKPLFISDQLFFGNYYICILDNHCKN